MLPIFDQLIQTKLYLGHHKSLTEHYISNFTLGHKKKITIINLLETYTLLKKTIPIINHLTFNNNHILIINTISLKKSYLENFKSLNLTIIEKWKDGWISNFKHHRKHKHLLFSFYPTLVINLNANNKITNETSRYKIPLINITDTNYNPYSLLYPIPANNKALMSSFFFLFVLKKICITQYINKLYKFKY